VQKGGVSDSAAAGVKGQRMKTYESMTCTQRKEGRLKSCTYPDEDLAACRSHIGNKRSNQRQEFSLHTFVFLSLSLSRRSRRVCVCMCVCAVMSP
jgi:hypothetical protein